MSRDFWVPKGMSFQDYMRSALRDLQEYRWKQRIIEEAKARREQAEKTEETP